MRAALPQLIRVSGGDWIVFSREARLAHHSAGEVVRGRDLPGGARLLLHGGELLSQHLHTPTLTAGITDISHILRVRVFYVELPQLP